MATSDLSPHLHTEECNVLINLLNDCIRNESLIKRYIFDGCAYWNIAVAQCTHEERLIRRQTNPSYGKRLTEIRRLPEERYTQALKKLKAQGKLNLDEGKGGGCGI